jgi:hypothetical protein
LFQGTLATQVRFAFTNGLNAKASPPARRSGYGCRQDSIEDGTPGGRTMPYCRGGTEPGHIHTITPFHRLCSASLVFQK